MRNSLGGACVDECIELSMRPDLIRQLVPSHAEKALRAQGIDIEGFVPIPLEELRISLDVGNAFHILLSADEDLTVMTYHV